MLPPLLLSGKTGGGMSGSHFESLTAVNIHEVQNIIVFLLSFVPKEKERSDTQ